MQSRLLLLMLAVGVLASCARKPSLTAEFIPRSLVAVNTEEAIGNRDEVMMAYSLTSYDAQNKPVGVVNGAWGVEPIKKGQQLDLQSVGRQQPEQNIAKPIQLSLPKNGKIVASLVLIEVDDYNQAKQTLAKIQKIHNMVAVPVGLLLTATEVLTPLKYVSAGLAASGIGLQLVDKFDDDDLLGQSSVELQEAALRQKKQRLVHVPATFSGKHLHNAFEYQLTYDVILKIVKIQPTRQ